MMKPNDRQQVPLLVSFVAGAVSCFLCVQFWNRRKSAKSRASAGATPEGDDLSLFYGNVDKLTTITEASRFLPKEVYGEMVRNAVVCCVDVVAVRTNENFESECLLVERGSEPVKGVWWWPGGRLLKGETFFAAATRKTKEETGLQHCEPIQVLGVWNTFFPTSNWDTPQRQGTQTVNAVVLVSLDQRCEVKLDETSENYRWISTDPEEAESNGEDRYVVEALLRLKGWKESLI